MASVRKMYWFVHRDTRKRLRSSQQDESYAERVESSLWVACYMDSTGKRCQKKTGEKSYSKALAKAVEWEKPYRDGQSTEKDVSYALGILRTNQALLRNGKARDEFRRLYEDVFKVELEACTVRAFAATWLKRRKTEVKARTYEAYQYVVNRFVDFLGDTADSDIRLVTREHVTNYRNSVDERLSSRTANNHLKMIRIFLNDARRDGLLDRNPAEDVVRVKEGKTSERRAFTPDELKAVYKVANDEWQGMLLFGIYTGQRLGDIARLSWLNLDLDQKQVALNTAKTDRRVTIPLAGPLYDYLLGLDAPDVADAPVFPEAQIKAESYGANGPLSKEFNELLVSAGLISAPKPAKTGRKSPNRGKGMSNRRQSAGLSFHSLRHTATSMLKNAGVSEAVAMDIIGHDSKAVSQIYTHVEDAPKREALAKLPDITG